MNNISIVSNLSFLFLLIFLHIIVVTAFRKNTLMSQFIIGALYSLIIVLAMINPLFEKSFYFDSRSVVLFIGSYFGGFVFSIVFGLVSAISQIILDNGCIYMGTAIIVISILFGLVARKTLLQKPGTIKKDISLLLFVFLNHVFVILILWFFPGGNKEFMLKKILFPVLTVFPIISWLIYFAVSRLFNHKKTKNILINEQENFKQLVENGNMYHIRFLENGTVTYINQKYSALCGKTITSNPIFIQEILFVENSSVNFGDIIEKIKVNNDYLSKVEDILIDQKNNPVYIIWSFKGFFNTSNQLTDIIASGIDVTERHNLKLSLDNSEEHLKLIFDLAADAILIGNSQGNIIKANEKAFELTEYREKELIGRNIGILFSKEETDRTPLRYDLINKGIVVQTERALTRKNGTTVFVEMNSKKLPLGTFSTIIRDIDKRKQQEDILRKSEEKYHSLFESSNYAILLLHNYNIVDCNQQATKLFRTEKECLIGKSPWEISPKQQKGRLFSETLAKKFIDNAANGNNQEFAWHHISFLSEEIPCQIKLIRVLIGGNNFVQAIIIDKSEQVLARQKIVYNQYKLIEQNNRLNKINKQLEIAKTKAEESDKLKSSFLANMSHEIRTPINGILGFSELLKRKNLDYDKIKLFTSVIEKSGEQLLALINDIIDLSKIEAKQARLNIDVFNLDDMISDIYNLYSQNAINKGISLIITKNIEDSIIVIGDQHKIKQVLGNIVSNALKFTKKGSVELIYEQLNNDIRFIVSDTGIGIANDDIPKIFERFRQIETDLGKNLNGTGLGLAISKSLIELMSGKISVESVSGKGTKFIIDIPLKIEFHNSQKEISTATLNNHQNIDFSGKKILIAEDEQINMLLIRGLLAEKNAIITEATNGVEAIELIKTNSNFDLILMDIKMPKINGIEASQRIKEINSKIPVIAITALAMEQEIEFINQTGIDNIITKPIDPRKLYDIVSKYLG